MHSVLAASIFLFAGSFAHGYLDTAPIVPRGNTNGAGLCRDPLPVPAGFSQVRAAPANALGTFGVESAMALDGQGYPMVAYVHYAPGGNVTALDSLLYFTRWNGCSWTQPVVVRDPSKPVDQNPNVLGPIGIAKHLRQVAIAYDAATGAIGIAYQNVWPHRPNQSNPIPTIWAAVSTNQGASWTLGQVSVHDATKEGDHDKAASPGLAMYGGKMFIGYSQDNVYCQTAPASYCKGTYAEGSPTTGWTYEVLPNLPGGDGLALGAPVSVALDANHQPALAYVVTPYTAYNTQIAAWRPHTKGAYKVADSGNHQSDDPAVSLAFSGTNPRAAVQLSLGHGNELLYVAGLSEKTWGTPVTLPKDGTGATQSWISLAVGGTETKVAVVGRAAGGSNAVCGAPKIVRLVNNAWTACGADATGQLQGTGGEYVSAAYGANGKLTVAFRVTDNTADPIRNGVAIWREP